MKQLFIGLMSGTSLDGIDVALVDFSQATPQLIATHLEPIIPELREQLLALSLPGNNEIDRMGEADNAFALNQVTAIENLLAKTDYSIKQVTAVGSHGQTIRHRPDFDSPFTLQIGNPALMTEKLSCTVIADFRRRDMAAGGQGAPLVPAFHEWLFQHDQQLRFVVNIGGIANVTVLHTDSATDAVGYDTGPGNVLMDYWVHKNQGVSCDKNGRWATTGQVIPKLLNQLMKADYLHLSYPKSTGRELFNGYWLEEQLALTAIPASTEDVQATLLEFTALTITNAIQSHKGDNKQVFLCGGGAENQALFSRIQDLLGDIKLAKTEQLGVPAVWLEACAFAWLAKRCLEGLPGNLPAVTGAKKRRILGAIYQV